MRSISLLLAILLVPLPVLGKEWSAIPPEVWALKSDPSKGIEGAIVLDEKVKYDNRFTDVQIRVRLLSDDGKRAVATPRAYHFEDLEGRTVQPDGRVTSFDKRQDLVNIDLHFGDETYSSKKLIPPGLTGNCVVDLHYRIGRSLPTPESFYYFNQRLFELNILEAFPIQRKILEIASHTGLGSLLTGTGDIRYQEKDGGDLRTFTFENLPADMTEPYDLVKAGECPRFIFFVQPYALKGLTKGSPDVYWREAGKKYFKPIFTESIKTGPLFKEWSDTIRIGLKGNPAERASVMFTRLQQRIQNCSSMTYAEQAALSKDENENRLNPFDLDASVKNRRTTNIGMQLLFFKLLQVEELNPKILFVVDREQGIFDYRFPCVNQFTATLYGILGENGESAWYDPALRYFPPGVIPPEYQGLPGLLVDPKDWSCKPYPTPTLEASANRSTYTCTLNLGEEETFTTKAEFYGYPEYLERKKYLSLEPKEQVRLLKEHLNPLLKGATLSKAGVENTTNSWSNLIWTVEGTWESEEGSRQRINPFPGMKSPLVIPESWPEKRKGIIVMPYCFETSASSHIRVPTGWRLTGEEPMVQSNEFGTVKWRLIARATETGEEADVIFVLQVKRLSGPPTSYEALKQFLAWVKTGWQRTVLVERKS